MIETIVTAVATVALAFITYRYLVETRKMRELSQKSFQADLLPKIFLENMEFKPDLNESTKEIVVTAIFSIKNAGKTQANNFVAEYEFSMGELRKESEIKVPYLFPNQGIKYPTKLLGWVLNEPNFAVAKEAKEQKKPLQVPESAIPPVLLNLTLKYIDQEEEEHIIPYKMKYTLHNNSWSFLEEED